MSPEQQVEELIREAVDLCHPATRGKTCAVLEMLLDGWEDVAEEIMGVDAIVAEKDAEIEHLEELVALRNKKLSRIIDIAKGAE